MKQRLKSFIFPPLYFLICCGQHSFALVVWRASKGGAWKTQRRSCSVYLKTSVSSWRWWGRWEGEAEDLSSWFVTLSLQSLCRYCADVYLIHVMVGWIYSTGIYFAECGNVSGENKKISKFSPCWIVYTILSLVHTASVKKWRLFSSKVDLILLAKKALIYIISV